MKKMILILFLFLLCFMCYFIYNKTRNNKLYVTQIGDYLSQYNYFGDNSKIVKVNIDFTDKDMRIVDLENELVYYNDKSDNKNIHQILKKTDILVMAVGMNDIDYKLKDNTKNIYTYLNNIVSAYDEIFKQVSKYAYKKVIVLGYYNIRNDDNDIYTYINYKIKRMTDEYNYTFLDLNKIFYNNDAVLLKANSIYLNEKGFRQISKLIVENIKKYDII